CPRATAPRSTAWSARIGLRRARSSSRATAPRRTPPSGRSWPRAPTQSATSRLTCPACWVSWSSWPGGRRKGPTGSPPDHRRGAEMSDAVLRALVVDDDPDTRANLTDILELDRYAVECAGTLAEALQRAADSEPFAVILDRKLPDGNAEDLLPRL